jgi:hypothetical protein
LWHEFTQFDKRDQAFFHELAASEEAIVDDGKGPRLTLRPFMRVLNETIHEYAIKGYLKKVDKELIAQLTKSLREHGYDPAEFGLTEEVLRARLTMGGPRNVPAMELPVQYQKHREQLKVRLAQDGRSAADAIINRVKLKHGGKDLMRYFPGKGDSNVVILIALVHGWLNKQMSLESGERDNASVEQLERGIDRIPDAVDAVTKLVTEKLKEGKGAKV